MKAKNKFELPTGLWTVLTCLLFGYYGHIAKAANPEPAGWYAGDMHVHRSCGGTPESVTSLYNKMATNNLAAISLLADMGNGEVQNPITDLPLVSGLDATISTPDRIVHWDAEWHWDATYSQFEHQALGGHLVALGLNEAHQIWEEYTYPMFQWAHPPSNTGIAGFAHMQYLDDGFPQTLNCCIPIEYPVEVALGEADFISEDVTGSDTAIRAYYRLLNTGFRPGFAAGTDYPCGVSELGSLLTYVMVADGQMTYRNWIEGIKAGRTVVSRNGHNEFLNLKVNNTATPGDEIPLSTSGSVPVTIFWTANKNLSGTIELVQNGVVVASKQASVTSSTSANLTANVNFTKSGWLAARRMDINGHQTHTGAVFVIVNNEPVRASAEDAEFYVQWMDNLLTNTSPGGVWNSFFPTNLISAQSRYLDAKTIFQQIAVEAGATPKPLTITTTSLPKGVLGLPYSTTLSASGGFTPYSWSIASGLPTGLTLINGTITGTPASAGFNSFSAQVSDAGIPNQTVSKQLNITIDATPPASSTIWSPSSVPVVAADSDASPVELGVKFRASTNGFITGIRFYKGATNTGDHTGSLWDISGNLLARATFTNSATTGWQQVSFTTPVAITANTVYVASYHTNVGHYSVDVGYFANTGITDGLLYALRDGENGGNGLYTYSVGPSFPNATYQSSNYWVDAVFTTNPVDTTAPSKPTNLNAIATSVTQVKLTWTASTDNIGVNRYIVERCLGASCNGTSFTQIASPTVNSFVDSGLTPGTTYRYRVKAVDAAGNQSVYTAIVTAATTVIATPDTFLFKSGVQRTVNYAGPLGLGVLANDADSNNLPLNSVLVGTIPAGVTLANTGVVTINSTANSSFKYRANNGSVLSLPTTGATVLLRLNSLPKAVIDNCTYNRAGNGSITPANVCVMTATPRMFSMNLKANDTDPNVTTNKPSDGIGDAVTGAVITATGTGVSVSANAACGQAAIGTSTSLARIINRCNGTLNITVAATAPASPIKFTYKAVDDLKSQSAAVTNTVTIL